MAATPIYLPHRPSIITCQARARPSGHTSGKRGPHTSRSGGMASGANGRGGSGGGGRFTHLPGSTQGSDGADAAYLRSNPDLLCVVLDIDPSAWTTKSEGLERLARAVQDLCIFLNAHSALRHDNCCAVYVAGRSNG